MGRRDQAGQRGSADAVPPFIQQIARQRVYRGRVGVPRQLLAVDPTVQIGVLGRGPREVAEIVPLEFVGQAVRIPVLLTPVALGGRGNGQNP